ncbi:hypothetical protein E4P82_16405 [Candidatus Competibacter phosphatis]|uniref:MobA-like NTP transferase domain-containing protein n=1 Tax=Candidatus Competibacter phosphatis TaxID=221280 RepID=A0ABX1TMJ5_9GAMM|nr:NTP transferase domain-containing protein [Candidatus Competibacter phosphatis]NMQ20637.1 hypothetical protein [Candidatus Competibacter phosphatis]
MGRLRALVAAAGRGSRAGLPYPKTLFPIQGKPILIRIVELLTCYDNCPTIVVSPEGEAPIRECLEKAGLAFHLVLQPKPQGMGDAVLRFQESPAFKSTDHGLLIWGDIPFLQPATIGAAVKAHFEHDNDFTFVTSVVDSAYTVVTRDISGGVIEVVETREHGIAVPQAGERDIGLFVFRNDVTLNALQEELPGKYGRITSEHGFLYIIGSLAKRGLRVEALPIATELDLVSMNTLKDVEAHL